MTEGPDLRRQVWLLRVRLAHAEETAAGNYKVAAIAALIVSGFLWAALSTVLEGGPEDSAHWLGAGPVALAALLLWTASQHHHAREKVLAEVMAEARVAGYSVEIMQSGIHFAVSAAATTHEQGTLKKD